MRTSLNMELPVSDMTQDDRGFSVVSRWSKLYQSFIWILSVVIVYNIKKSMVYVRFPVSKHGINPSPQTMLNVANLTPTQKVMLTKNRIWGNMIGGNERSGY
jgi:hypothetical protein